MGYGIVGITATGMHLVKMDVLKLPARYSIYQRLQLIHTTVADILKSYHPDEFAIEAPFFGKNVQSMLKLGRAQGVAIAAAMQSGIPVTEYSPRKIKQSVAGNGNADKIQVLKMLQRLLHFEEDPAYLDATDALAVAVCHHFQGGHGRSPDKETVNDWKGFLAKNPGRVK